ncbi:septum formation initiator family protein [Candidatus Aerophobetes bacterium]|nr:septum formation initiator family protein [Candidatus Aerophobetes bacterium]
MKDKFFLIFIIGSFIFLLFWGIKSYLKVNQAKNRVKKLEEKLEELRIENETLKKEEENLKNPFYIEKLAREKLGLAKEGEIIYKILPGGD